MMNAISEFIASAQSTCFERHDSRSDSHKVGR